jgi:hypothetical protein
VKLQVLRGLETFSQLVQWDWDNHTHVIRAAPWWIQDAPRFAHRAFMIGAPPRAIELRLRFSTLLS